MLKVWKYELNSLTEQAVNAPAGAVPVAAGMQGDTACIWALVDPEAPDEELWIEITGTGHPVSDGAEHFATVFDNPFVWHFFVRGKS